jgi:hypothetical protein
MNPEQWAQLESIAAEHWHRCPACSWRFQDTMSWWLHFAQKHPHAGLVRVVQAELAVRDA